MNIDKLTSRINYLYKKSQVESLTEEEKQEQKDLRQEYVENVKRNFRGQLETVRKIPTTNKN